MSETPLEEGTLARWQGQSRDENPYLTAAMQWDMGWVLSLQAATRSAGFDWAETLPFPQFVETVNQ